MSQRTRRVQRNVYLTPEGHAAFKRMFRLVRQWLKEEGFSHHVIKGDYSDGNQLLRDTMIWGSIFTWNLLDRTVIGTLVSLETGEYLGEDQPSGDFDCRWKRSQTCWALGPMLGYAYLPFVDEWVNSRKRSAT